MKGKKFLSVVTASCLMVSLFAMPVLAHHGGGCHRRTQITYTTCTTEGCNITYNHMHDGQYCYGHYLNDGHDYHQACTLEGCTEAGVHYHDEVCYFGCHQGEQNNSCVSGGYGCCH